MKPQTVDNALEEALETTLNRNKVVYEVASNQLIERHINNVADILKHYINLGIGIDKALAISHDVNGDMAKLGEEQL